MGTDYNSKAKALDSIINSVRDLQTLKIKLPMGNPNLKLVHTNQFLFTELPEEVFELANMGTIAKALNSKYARFSGYKLNRWYIEGITITNDNKSCIMELECNPFASPLTKYQENNRGYKKAYSDAYNQKKQAEEQAKQQANKSKSGVKSTNTGIKLKNVKGFSKDDQKYIKKIVKQALKKRNNPTNEKPILYALYEYYKNNHVYSGYECMQKIRAGGFKYTWKKQGHNCGDGAAVLVAMFRCAGLKADIMHKYGHFYVRVKANGEWYYCDQSGASGAHNWRSPGKKGNNNNVFHGISSSASVVGFKYC